jgi:hypothetical protein
LAWRLSVKWYLLLFGEPLYKVMGMTTQPVGEADGMTVAQGEASAASETLGSIRRISAWAASRIPKHAQLPLSRRKVWRFSLALSVVMIGSHSGLLQRD